MALRRSANLNQRLEHFEFVDIGSARKDEQMSFGQSSSDEYDLA